MRKYDILFNVKLLPTIVCLVSVSVFAGSPTRFGLGVSPYADTEISTNVQLAVWEKDLKRFEFNLAFLATPSNNVQVSFGVDEDGDGRLSAHEERIVMGWDCGEWFAHASRSSGDAASRFFAKTTPEGFHFFLK